MPSFDPNRYRAVEFVGGRILQARELQKMQEEARGVNDNNVQTSWNLDALYRDGATLNVTATVTGFTVTFGPTDPTKPMLVFVRQQWEQLQSVEASPVTLDSMAAFPKVYLNYQIVQVTSATDPSLVDVTSGEPTADMGQLYLEVSATDDSATPLAGNQFEKNTIPIVLFSYSTTNTTLILIPLDNVQEQAYGTLDDAGLVQLTTATSSGVAVSTDDTRMSNARDPNTGSVIDASVRTPISPGGTNPDGTTIYNLTGDAGGISAAKIVFTASTQLLSDAWSWLRSGFLTLLGRYNSHEGAALGSGTTHPFPTATQVGAAPLSHVGQPLGLPTSHPPTAALSQGGFQIVRDPAVPAIAGDAAFSTTQATTLLNGLMHDGNIFSSLADDYIATPLQEAGDATLGSGPLGYVALMARVLSEHVNKTSHKNPHGVTLADLGGAGLATKVYVDAEDVLVLQSAQNYTNAQVPHLSITTQPANGQNSSGTYVLFTFQPNGGFSHTIGIGMGVATIGGPSPALTATLPLPSGGFSAAQQINSVSIRQIDGANGDIDLFTSNVSATLQITGNNVRFDGSGNQKPASLQIVSWTCVCWI